MVRRRPCGGRRRLLRRSGLGYDRERALGDGSEGDVTPARRGGGDRRHHGCPVRKVRRWVEHQHVVVLDELERSGDPLAVGGHRERRPRRGVVHLVGEPDRDHRVTEDVARPVTRPEAHDTGSCHGSHRHRQGRQGDARGVLHAIDDEAVLRIRRERLARDERVGRRTAGGGRACQRTGDRRIDPDRRSDRGEVDRLVERDRERGIDGRSLVQHARRGEQPGRRVTGEEGGASRLGHRPSARGKRTGADRDRVVGRWLPGARRDDRDARVVLAPFELERDRRLDRDARPDRIALHRGAEQDAGGRAKVDVRRDGHPERGLRQGDDVARRRRVRDSRTSGRDGTERHDPTEGDRDPAADEPGSAKDRRRVHAEQHRQSQDRDEELPQYRTWLRRRGRTGWGLHVSPASRWGGCARQGSKGCPARATTRLRPSLAPAQNDDWEPSIVPAGRYRP